MKPAKKHKFEIVHLQTNADGTVTIIDSSPVLPHLIQGAKQLCRVHQDAYDKKCLPVRVYLHESNIPVYAAYGVERNQQPALKKVS